MYFKCFESINLWGSDNSSSISIQRRQKWMTCEHSNNFMLWNPRIICGYGVLNNTNRKIWTTCIDGWWCLHIISIYSSSSVWLNNRAHSQFVLTLVIVFHFFFSSARSVSTIMPNKHRLHLSHVKQFVCFSFFSLSFWGLYWSFLFFREFMEYLYIVLIVVFIFLAVFEHYISFYGAPVLFLSDNTISIRPAIIRFTTPHRHQNHSPKWKI